jgi:transmembrane sensor
LQISALWEDAPLLAKDGDLDVDALIERTVPKDNVVHLVEGPVRRENKNRTPRNRSRLRSLRFGRPRIAMVGAAALVVVIAVLLTVIKPWVREYVTDVGEQQTITLRDGSTIELNSRSRARVAYSKSERGVELLEGQALFHVAKDPSRPFVVKSGPTRVRAVGTRFDVYRKESGTTVTVVEGRVLVSNVRNSRPAQALAAGVRQVVQPGAAAPPEGDTAVLNAGEQITVARNIPLQASAADVETTTAWTQRRMVFKSAPLPEVAAEYNRYNPRRLVVGSAALRDFHISGVFAAADGASLVEFLRAQPNLSVRTTDSEIQITTKEP